MEEIIFEIDHQKCPFNDISRNHPDATLWHWCNLRVDFFDVQGEGSRAILRDVERLARGVNGQVGAEHDITLTPVAPIHPLTSAGIIA